MTVKNTIEPSLSSPTASGSYKSYVLAALSIVAFFNFLDRSIFSVLAVSIKSDLGLSDTEIGLLGGVAFALFYAVLGLPLARIADRSNRVRLVSICLAVWSAATVACAAAVNFVTLLLARIGVGAGEAGCFPPSYSILSDYYEPDRRAFAIGMFHAGGNVGFLIGLMAAGVLADEIGWRWTFVILGAPGVLFALLFAATVKEPKRQGEGEDAEHATPEKALSMGKALKVILAKPALNFLTIGYTWVIFAFYSALAWLPHFFTRTFDMSGTSLGLWYGLAFGGGMILGVTIGAFLSTELIKSDKRWEVWFPGLAALMAFPAFIAIHFVGDINAALWATAFGSAAVASGLGPGFSAVQSLSEANVRATAAAIVLLVSAIVGQGLGPTFTGMLSDVLNADHGDRALSLAMIISAIPFLVASAFYYLASRNFTDQIVGTFDHSDIVE